jgi:hypothetical protein
MKKDVLAFVQKDFSLKQKKTKEAFVINVLLIVNNVLKMQKNVQVVLTVNFFKMIDV